MCDVSVTSSCLFSGPSEATSREYTPPVQAGTSALTAPFGRDVIESIIPHRDPFLFLDEVTELEPGRRVVARRQVRPDEWFFPGHFPERPIMPGVIIVEALVQAGAVAVL